MLDPRFENLMKLFDARKIPRVPWESVEVGVDKLMPDLHFSVDGPRDSVIFYDIEGYDAVSAWFGKSNSDSGGMFLHGTLRMREEDLPKPAPRIVLATPEQAKRMAFYDVLNRARAYPLVVPQPPEPEPPWRVAQPLNRIINLHKRFMASGRLSVIKNYAQGQYR